MIEKLKDKKVLGIILGIVIVLLIALIIMLVRGKTNGEDENEIDALAGIFPNGSELVELNLGTYYNEKQADYCKIKLPENYYGWAIYLAADNSNQNFEMATSHFLSDSISNGILEQEEAIQQFHYSNSQLIDENTTTTDIYATIFNPEQITYEGMKSQMSGAIDIKEIGDVAFYSKGDKKYTDIDVTMYYKLTEDLTLEISYKGPLADEIGVDKIANKLYDLIEVIK